VSSSMLEVDLSDSSVGSVLSGVVLGMSNSPGFSVVLGSPEVLSGFASVLSHGSLVSFGHSLVMSDLLGMSLGVLLGMGVPP